MNFNDFSGSKILYEKIFFDGFVLDSGTVFQISECTVVPGGEIPCHKQWCDEITYVVSGRAEVLGDTAFEILNPGDLHFVKKECNHHIKADEREGIRFLCLGFMPSDKVDEYSGYSENMNERADFLIKDDVTVKRLMGFLLDEFYESDEKSERMISAYLEQIIVNLSRYFAGKKTVVKNFDAQSSDSVKTVYRIIRYIDRNFMQIGSVKEVADALSYSEYYISHIFRQKTGTGIKEYLTGKKMMYACDFLRNSGVDVERLAESLSYTSAHSFRRTFKSYTGLSPTEYRKKNKT